MIDLETANEYFSTEVLHTEEWDTATDLQKQKALKQAENQLYRFYTNFDRETRPLPDYAIFEQALWLLRIDETIRRAEMGVTSITVSGIQISVSQKDNSIAPAVVSIVGRRIGRSVIG